MTGSEPSAAAPRALPRLDALTAYRRSSMPACVDLRLDGNEGARPDPALLEALRDAGVEVLRCYPSTAELEDRLAARHGVAAEQVLVTAGGDEGLDRVFRAFCEPGRNVVMPVPSFEMLPRYAALAGCAVREVPWPDGPFPVDLVLAAADAATAAVFVVTPNNPTGAVASADAVRHVAAAVPHALVVVDHAYAEFGDRDLTADALALPNAVVVRTLSKAWGLAGLRTGYVLGSPALVDALRKAGSPYTVPGPSVALALRALAGDRGAVAAFVERVRAERVRLAAQLRGHGFVVPESQGNFVLARGPRSAWLCDALRGLGIAVRSFAGRPSLDDAVRITCPGDPAAFARLGAAVAAALCPDAVLFGSGRGPSSALPAASGVAFEAVDLPGDPAAAAAALQAALLRLGASRAWLVAAHPDHLDAARACGIVPLGLVADSAAAASGAPLRDDLLRHGAARVLGRPNEITELL